MDRPAWQTDELEEEWIEEDEDSLLSASRSNGSATSSISLTEAIGSLDITDRHGRSTGSVVSQCEDVGGTVPRGTFVVRDDVEAAPLMPKTPNAKVGFKGMFTPLALEKMFEPPSPPAPAPGPSTSRQPSPTPAHTSPPVSAVPRLSTGPSPLSQTHLPVPTSIPTVQVTPSTSFALNISSSAPPPAPHPTISEATTTQVPSTEFTFSAPRQFTTSPFPPNHTRGALAESTPGPSKHNPSQNLNIATPLPGHGSGPRLPQPPATDPRLRLFQFQYDTFTRDHLSAILDNLPVQSGSPSTTNFSPNGSVPLSAGPVASAFAHTLSSSRFEHAGEVSADDQDISASAGGSINRMRATKRVKLSLRDQSNTSADAERTAPISARTRQSNESYGEGAGAGAHIARPKSAPQDPQMLQAQGQAADKSTSRRDYVKESQAFMQQLKAHRDFSTVSTMSALAEGAEGSPTTSKARAVSNPTLPSSQPAPLPSPNPLAMTMNSDSNPFGSKRPVSSLVYRQQAADLMAQIRMGSRRMFSVATVNSDQDQDNSTTSVLDGKDPAVVARDFAAPPLQPDPTSAQEVADVPASGRTTSTSSAGRSSSASTIPGFVFTSRKPSTQQRQVSTQSQSTAVGSGDEQGVGRPQQPRKRSRLSTDPDDVDVEVTPKASAKELSRTPSAASTRIPSTLTADRSPTPTLSAFPLPPASNTAFDPVARAQAMQAQAQASAPARTTLLYPTETLRNRAGQDVNRYVSSSTTASGESTATGTTAMTSVGSFVKHPGPPAEAEKPSKGPRAITQIRPEDVGALPRQIGSMVFDSRKNIWQHARKGRNDPRRNEYEEADMDLTNGTTDDPFRDIESLRDGDESLARNSRSRLGGRAQDMVYPAEDDTREIVDIPPVGRSMIQDEHSRLEIDPNSFSIDDADVVPVMTGIEHTRRADIDDSDGTTDSEDEQDFLEMTASSSMTNEDRRHEFGDTEPSSEVEPVNWRAGVAGSSFTVEALPDLPTLPARTIPVIPPTPALRPAMKSASVTPISALKTPRQGQQARYSTPAPSSLTPGHRRSVSFSDGKREGQIRGVGREEITVTTVEDSDGESEDRSLSALQTGDRSTFVPSARSKRIADMLAVDDESAFVDSPSRTSSARSSLHEVQLNGQANGSLRSRDGSTSRRSLSRSNASLFMAEPARKGDATFLTEWSFEVAHDRLVTVITDVQPFKPYWEELDAIALDDKHLDSVARLKEFLPKLDALSLNANQLTYLTGVPSTVRTLSVSHNCLTSVTSFQHLLNLENLDISRNEVDSLQHLSCLRHLRELRADGNQITSTDGLQNLDSLVKLSLQGNRIREVDFSSHRWPRLEMLNMSDNRLEAVEHLEALSVLVALNLDFNVITTLDTSGTMPKLRVLRLSNNKLQRLNGAAFPNIRTLYADNNAITGLDKAHRLLKLENLSLRNQSGKGLKLHIRDVRDVKRLYLSGNPLDGTFLQDACYNLIYLEVAACRLTVLPPNFGALVPNLRVLNLNYNFLSDLRPIEGLSRLKKLTLIGSRLTTSKALIKCVRGMSDVEMLDFRMNPCTLGWYLPLLVRDAPGALQPSEGKDGRTRDHATADERSTGTAWRDLDAKFRKDLPDEAYVGRLVYRGLVMQSCPHIKLLDGVPITSKEKDKAGRLLESILANRASAPRDGAAGA